MSMMLMVQAMKAKIGNPIRKLVLIKLADNANDDGICWPSYRHVADHCEVERSTVIRHVKWLEDNKFLTKQFRKDEERGNKSNIYKVDIASGIEYLVSQKDYPSSTEQPAPSSTELPRTSHSLEPVIEPVNTMSSSANIDQLPSQPSANQLAKNQRIEAAKQLLEYLNTQASRQYRPTPSNLKLITSRLDEGYTPDDVARVIERKCEEWLSDNKMVQYLRPSTLFNATKFNNYVGQLSAPLPTNNNKSSNGLAADDLSWMNGMDEML